MDNLLSTLTNEVKCTICLETVVTPITCLPCLHNFCHDCLYEHILAQYNNDDDNALCPMRCPINTITHNVSLDNIISVINTQTIKDVDEENIREPLNNIQEYLQKINKMVTDINEIEMREPCNECETIRECINFGHERYTCDTCNKVYRELESESELESYNHECVECEDDCCSNCEHIFSPTDAIDITIDNLYDKHILDDNKENAWVKNQYIKEHIIKYLKDNNISVNDVVTEEIKSTNMKYPFEYGKYCPKCYYDMIFYHIYNYTTKYYYEIFPDDEDKKDCYYGYECRTQKHNYEHAKKLNHLCDNTTIST